MGVSAVLPSNAAPSYSRTLEGVRNARVGARVGRNQRGRKYSSTFRGRGGLPGKSGNCFVFARAKKVFSVRRRTGRPGTAGALIASQLGPSDRYNMLPRAICYDAASHMIECGCATHIIIECSHACLVWAPGGEMCLRSGDAWHSAKLQRLLACACNAPARRGAGARQRLGGARERAATH